jgi:hypothetical protein
MKIKKFEREAVSVMNENPNQSMPKRFANYLRGLPLEVTREKGQSNQITRTIGGGKHALLTVTQRFGTKNDSDDDLIEEAFDELEKSIAPQCKKLFKYDSGWRNVDDKTDYEFLTKLELVRGDDGYVLYARFH